MKERVDFTIDKGTVLLVQAAYRIGAQHATLPIPEGLLTNCLDFIQGDAEEKQNCIQIDEYERRDAAWGQSGGGEADELSF